MVHRIKPLRDSKVEETNETLKTTGNSQRLNDTALKKYSKYFACCFDVVVVVFFFLKLFIPEYVIDICGEIAL